MSRLPLLVGNWKMSLGVAESARLAHAIKEQCSSWVNKVQAGVCPSPACLAPVAQALALPQEKNPHLLLGAQNLHWAVPSAQTGETSSEQASELGATFTLIGHSERRHGLGESQELVDRRTLGLLEKDFSVLLCIGETLEEREQGITEQVLSTQLAAVIKKIPAHAQPLLDVAYEPVWAIGTGKVASLQEIEAAHRFIVDQFVQSGTWLQTPRIVYGGSVKPDNFADILQIPNVSGALVGGASLQAESFLELIKLACCSK